MNINIRQRTFPAMRNIACAGLMGAVLLLPVHALAALGGTVSSVDADQRQMKASARTLKPMQKYTVHEITSPSGTIVREYVSPDGKVFGVAWRGPFLPNFQQLLGDYYAQFAEATKTAKTAAPRRSRNAPVSVDQPSFVMRSKGHMRAYAGQAFVPGMIPEGVDASDIQ